MKSIFYHPATQWESLQHAYGYNGGGRYTSKKGIIPTNVANTRPKWTGGADPEKTPAKDALAKYRDELTGIVNNSYMDVLTEGEICESRLSNYVQNAKINYQYSHKRRIHSRAQQMKLSYDMPTTDTIVTVLRFAYNRSEHGLSNDSAFACIHSTYEGTKFTHRFVCNGPTYKSMDGEFRGNVITWDQQRNIVHDPENKYAIDMIEGRILDRINRGKLILLHPEVCFPIDCPVVRKTFLEDIDNSRVAIYSLILCWVADVYDIVNAIGINHMNKVYAKIICRGPDHVLYKVLEKRMGTDKMWVFSELVKTYNDRISWESAPTLSRVRVGQKIMQLSIDEIIWFEDISMTKWGEIYAMQLTSNLVLNLIAPGFAIINDWFYIQHAGPRLYDNPESLVQFSAADHVSHICTEVRRANAHTYRIEDDQKSGFINSKFMRLSKQLLDIVRYTRGTLSVTDLALCVTSEHVGRTLHDLPNLTIHKEHIPGFEHILTDSAWFEHHLFQFVYNIYCMNNHCKIIHGDLHMNNATIMRLFTLFTQDMQPKHTDAKVLYIANDYGYLFPYKGYYSVLIDFSRAIIGDINKIKNEFGESFAAKFINKQQQKIRDLLTTFHSPLLKELSPLKQEKFFGLCLTNYELAHRIISVTDIYLLAQNIHCMMTTGDEIFRNKQVMPAPGAIILLEQIIAYCENNLRKNMLNFIAGKITVAEDISWPALHVIEKFFSKYQLSAKQLADGPGDTPIFDIFNSHNSLKYDIRYYEEWGPILSADPAMKLREKYGLPIEEYVEARDAVIANGMHQVKKFSDDYKVTHPDDWMSL